MNDTEQLTAPNPFAMTTFEAVEKMASYIAESGMYGIKKPAQAVTLMMLAREEGKTLSQLLRQIHVFEDGKIAQRADYTQGDFQSSGNTIIFHVRTDTMCAATFVLGRADEKARERGVKRFELLWKLDFEKDETEGGKLMLELAKLSYDGEETIIRTLADAEEKGITKGSNGNTKANWKTSPRQMLTARCVIEGIKVVDPARSAGLYPEDEVEDIRKHEQQARLENKSPQQRDRESIQAMIDQHLEEAGTTKSQARKSELLGLAAELRCKLAEMDVPKEQPKPIEPVKEQPVKQQGEPTKVVDATDATVEPPPKTEPKSDPGEDHIPGLDLPPKQSVAEPTPWQQHKIGTFKSTSYRGKELGKLSPEEIEVLHNSAQKKLTNGQKDKEFLLEAAQIALAYEATRK